MKIPFYMLAITAALMLAQVPSAHAQYPSGQADDGESAELQLLLPNGVVWSGKDDPHTSITYDPQTSGEPTAGVSSQLSEDALDYLVGIVQGSAQVANGGLDYYGAASFSDLLSITLTNQNSYAVTMSGAEFIGSGEITYDTVSGYPEVDYSESNGSASISDSLGFLTESTSASLAWLNGQEISHSGSGQSTHYIGIEEIVSSEIIPYFTLAPGQTGTISIYVDGPIGSLAAAPSFFTAPEPGTYGLLVSLGLTVMGAMRRRRTRRILSTCNVNSGG